MSVLPTAALGGCGLHWSLSFFEPLQTDLGTHTRLHLFHSWVSALCQHLGFCPLLSSPLIQSPLVVSLDSWFSPPSESFGLSEGTSHIFLFLRCFVSGFDIFWVTWEFIN